MPLHADDHSAVYFKDFWAAARPDHIHIDVPAVNYRELRSTVSPESSADIRSRVLRVVSPSSTGSPRERNEFTPTPKMGSREIRKYCELGTESEHLLERAMVKQGLTARGP